jgi:rifampicin phosphotransferase
VPGAFMDYTRGFNQLNESDVELAGGKGANLGALSRLKVPVPAGFVITTPAYETFLAHNRLQHAIDRGLKAAAPANAIQPSFRVAVIPDDVAQSILAAYQELKGGTVAVRSSATAEDLPQAAFAGQQDTYLNIVGDEALLDAVRSVWASLWTERAIAYRKRLGIDQQQVRIAVVVQCMVTAEAAGVLFTANTVTGARDEMIIDASPGLGEAVVSGEVTPDHFVLRKHRLRWRIVERQMGRHEVTIRPRVGGGTERIRASTTISEPVLSDRALQRLVQLGSRIQRHFGRPQDIEFAWAKDEPFILQARAITALPSPLPRANQLTRLMAATFGELFAVRPYPLDLDTWIAALGRAIEPMFELLGIDWNLRNAFETEDGVAVRFHGRLPRPTWRTVLAPPRVLSLAVRYDALEWQSDPLLREAQARIRASESRDLQALSWKELLAAFDEGKAISGLAAGEVRRRYFPDAALAWLELRVLLFVAGAGKERAALLSGVDNKTLEVNRALEQLAHTIRSDPQLASIFSVHDQAELWSALERDQTGRAFLVELKTFLDRYGHREAVLGTALQPTWKDAPEVVLGILKSFAAHQPTVRVRVLFSRACCVGDRSAECSRSA